MRCYDDLMPDETTATDLAVELTEVVGLPAGQARKFAEYIWGKTSSAGMSRAIERLRSNDSFRGLVREAVSPELESIREQLDQVIDLLVRDSDQLVGTDVLPSYLLGEGYPALYEITGKGLSLKRFADMFRWDLEPLRFAARVASVGESIPDSGGLYPDAVRLRELGAPIPPRWTNESIPEVEALLALGADMNLVVTSAGDHWVPVAGEACDGAQVFDVFGAAAEEVTTWALENRSTRLVESTEESEFLVPMVCVEEPHFAGLVVSRAEGERLIVRSESQSLVFPLAQLAGRDLFVPIGTFYPGRSGSETRLHRSDELEVDPSIWDREIRPATLSVTTVLETGFLEHQHFFGPTFFPTHLKLDRRPEVPIRPPRGPELYERIHGWWSGASCPEVFVRSTSGRWRHVCSVLVNAIGPDARQTDVVPLDYGSGGEVEVILRELPGEVAYLSAALVCFADGQRAVLDSRANVTLDPWEVLHLKCSVDSIRGELALVVEGYFLQEARPVPRRPRGNVRDMRF